MRHNFPFIERRQTKALIVARSNLLRRSNKSKNFRHGYQWRANQHSTHPIPNLGNSWCNNSGPGLFPRTLQHLYSRLYRTLYVRTFFVLIREAKWTDIFGYSNFGNCTFLTFYSSGNWLCVILWNWNASSRIWGKMEKLMESWSW